MRAFLTLAALLVSLLFVPDWASAAAPRVLAVEFENDINPVTQDYVIGAIERAQEERYGAVVILLDTPGGLESAMRAIVKAELAARVPVIVYVYPQGARAASAGAFLAMGADVAAMAPGTNIGSATPIALGGERMSRDQRNKVVNDAAAYIRGLAREHGRNASWAERFVRRGSNLEAREALAEDVVDVVAPSLPVLLERIDGRRVQPKGFVLSTGGARVEMVEMSAWKRILDALIDPNLIVLLMSLGVLGITIEIMNPGLIFPGTFGAIALILGLFGLQVLPVSWAGVALILLAAALLAAEAFVVSHGALAVAGAVSFVFGALMLFDPAGPAYQVSLEVALAVGVTLALFVGVAVAKVVAVRRTRPQTGQEELIGQVGVVRERVDPRGLVFVHGELWRAQALDGPLDVGERVRVERVGDGLVLEVRRAGERAVLA